jgi:cytochrome P450
VRPPVDRRVRHDPRGPIANGVQRLHEHTDRRALLIGEPDRMREAIEKLLRYDTSVQNTARKTRTDVTLQGVTSPAGGRVALMLGAANREPHRWENPNTLDFMREAKRHVACGEGIHFCLGAERVPEHEAERPLERLPVHDLRLHTRPPIRI